MAHRGQKKTLPRSVLLDGGGEQQSVNGHFHFGP
jgi:hypothetical protein